MIKPTLALIPSGQKATKVYSVLPSDGTGDFTFARTGEATRVRKDGLIEAVATTVPRLDWLNSDCPILLLEPERTNRQFRSEQFDNAAWTKQADITVTANQVTAPTGELTADKIQRGSTTNTNNFLSDSANKSASSALDACTSVFVKQGEGDFFAFRAQGTGSNQVNGIYQFSNNTLTTSADGSGFTVTSSKVENYGNGWYRLSIVYNTDTAATITSVFSPRGSSGNVDATDISTSAFVYLWGCQVEEGVGSTSYIETPADAAVTRNAETCNNAGDANTFNDNEGVLYANIAALADDLTYRMIALSDSNSSDHVRIYYTASTNKISVAVKSNGSNQYLFLNHSVTDVTNFIKIAVKYKANDFATFINGVKVDDQTTTANTPIGLDRLNFDSGSGSSDFYGKCKDLRYYDTALTDEELKELTT